MLLMVKELYRVPLYLCSIIDNTVVNRTLFRNVSNLNLQFGLEKTTWKTNYNRKFACLDLFSHLIYGLLTLVLLCTSEKNPAYPHHPSSALPSPYIFKQQNAAEWTLPGDTNLISKSASI